MPNSQLVLLHSLSSDSVLFSLQTPVSPCLPIDNSKYYLRIQSEPLSRRSLAESTFNI